MTHVQQYHHLPMLELRDRYGVPMVAAEGQCTHPIPSQHVESTRTVLAHGEQLLPQLEASYREAVAVGVDPETLGAAMSVQLDALFEAHKRTGAYGEITLIATIIAAVRRLAEDR